MPDTFIMFKHLRSSFVEVLGSNPKVPWLTCFHFSYFAIYGPVWLDQNQIWILKSGSWNHGVLNKQNVRSESGFLEQLQNLDLVFIQMSEFINFIHANFIKMSFCFRNWFIVRLWTVKCFNNLSEVSTDTCPSPSAILIPMNPALGLVSWFHESGFGFRKSGLNKRNGFWNRLQFWSNQTGPMFAIHIRQFHISFLGI